jgi:CheY-like chemotaxis protein
MRIQTVPSESVDVLIVEDDPSARKTVRLLLEQSGYRCAEARDGHQALLLAHAEPPRCVLLDLAIPRLDGLTVARQLRADLRTFGTYICCLTGLRSPLVQEQAQRAGVAHFLTKPIEGCVLLEVLDREMKRAEPAHAAVISGLTKSQAENVLDWLEEHHCTGLAVTTESAGFAVRCVCPPGSRLVQEEDSGLRLIQTE